LKKEKAISEQFARQSVFLQKYFPNENFLKVVWQVKFVVSKEKKDFSIENVNNAASCSRC
jgi:hypothetical protein